MCAELGEHEKEETEAEVSSEGGREGEQEVGRKADRERNCTVKLHRNAFIVL